MINIPNRRFEFLDGLRGLMAIWVFLFHMSVSGNVDHLKAVLPAFFSQVLFEWGDLAVPVFFVISGFVIAHSLYGVGVGPGFFARFLVRRTVRLLPLYYASLALVLGVLTVRGIAKPGAISWPSAAVIVEHLTLTQGLFGATSLNVVYWTLCVEVQFYAAFALLFLAADMAKAQFSRLDLRLSLLLVALIVSLAWPTGLIDSPGYRGSFLPYWFAFLLGAVAYWHQREGGFATKVLYVTFVIMAVATGWGIARSGTAAVVATGLIVLAGAVGGMRRWLSARWLQSLGSWSYAFFLFHVPVTALYLSFSKRLLGNGAGPELLNLALALMINVIISALVFRWVDKPSVLWARSIALSSVKKADV